MQMKRGTLLVHQHCSNGCSIKRAPPPIDVADATAKPPEKHKTLVSLQATVSQAAITCLWKMSASVFASFEDALQYVRRHEEETNNKYVTVKRRKRGKTVLRMFVLWMNEN